MVSSDDINIIIKTTVDPKSQTELEQFQNEINKTQADLDQTVREGLRDLRLLQGIMMGTVRMLRGVAQAFGETLNPMHQALLDSVSMSVQTVLGIGAMYLAFPGWGWAIYGAIASFSLGFSIAARMDIRQHTKDFNTKIQGIQSALSGLQGMIGSIGYSGGFG